jgi:multidrug resistance efflux pump
MRRVLAPIVVTALALLLATDTEGRVVAASTVDEAPAKKSRDIDPEKFKASSASLSLEVPDPVKAHGDAERLLVKLGAEVNSSSASTDSGHLSVRIPERRLQSALDAVRAIPGRVGNVNRNTNDFTQSAKSAAERLQRLDRADAEIVRAIKSASDSDAVDGLMLLRELSQNDRLSQESQIDSLRQESERAQLHISFSVLR